MESQTFGRISNLGKYSTYVNDGVYVEYQPCSDAICLITARDSGEHYIHLELDDLLYVIDRMRKWQNEHEEQTRINKEIYGEE